MEKQNTPKQSAFHDVDWKFVVPSLVAVVAITIPAVIWAEDLDVILGNFFNTFVMKTDWIMMLIPLIMLACALYMSFSKYGNIVLGDPNEKPYMNLFTYLATLTAAQYGATIMRTGTTVWALSAADPMFGIEPYSDEAMVMGQAYSMYIWGPVMAALCMFPAPAVAYYIHNRKGSKTVHCSKVCACLFGDKFANGVWGRIFDLIFIIALVLGAATFLGLASPMVSAIVAKLTGMEASFMMNVIITVALVVLFTISAWLGLEKGIERLSRLNIWLAVALAAIILLAGPGLFILRLTVESTGEMLNHYIPFMFTLDVMNDSGVANATVSYTVFWWAYGFSWCLIYAVFTALISKGRTIRQMVISYLLTVGVFAIPMTGLLGGMAIDTHKKGLVDVFADMQEGTGQAIANILDAQTLGPVVMILFALLSFTFLGTTMDSTTYTMATYTMKGDMKEKAPSKGSRLIWALLMSGGALALMRIGGLNPLSTVSAIAGVPVVFVMFCMYLAGKKMMDQDKAWKTNVRAADWDPDTAPVAERVQD